MPRVYIDFSKFSNLVSECSSLSSELQEIEKNFSQTIKSLDWEIKAQENIETASRQITKKLENSAAMLKRSSEFLQQTEEVYRRLDDNENQKNTSATPFVVGGVISGVVGAAGIIGGGVNSSIGLTGKGNGGGKGSVIPASKTSILGSVEPAVSMTSFTRDEYEIAESILETHSTGAKAVAKSVKPTWGGTIISGAFNAFDNLKEKDESEDMSFGRVAMETVTETAIDTYASYLIGAAAVAASGPVSLPAMGFYFGGTIAYSAANQFIENVTGKSATEWVSDATVDFVEDVGGEFVQAGRSFVKWLTKKK